jgi:hypothetical protein
MQDIMTVKVREMWDWIIVPLEADVEACEIDEPLSEKKPFKL